MRPESNIREFEGADGSSSRLARRALSITLTVALAGSGIGLAGSFFGEVVGPELVLVVASFLFTSGALFTLWFRHSVPLQRVATVSTICFTVNLCSGAIIAVMGSGEHFNLFVYLVWFFPLLVFNRLVNEPSTGRLLARSLMISPAVIICVLSPRLLVIFSRTELIVIVVWGLSYAGFGTMFGVVTRYREEFITERGRAESLKVESEVLESISDCFISLDAGWKLVYLNDAACAEFGVVRRTALNDTIEHAVPDFFSHATLARMRAASGQTGASMIEAQNEGQNLWYEMRCFPRPGGMSAYFRNITEIVSARRKLDEAQTSVREQAELLDKAQDAIFVQDMDNRILYWNKSAERLYGWTSDEVTGRPAGEVLQENLTAFDESVAALMERGEWGGELSHLHRNGTPLIVESRCTLVRSKDGEPRSILSINTDITDRKAAEHKIHHLAFYDALTELPNRLLLRDRLENALATAVRRKNTGALLLIDLDDFKTLNDTLGHDIGDLLLQQVAARLTSCVRASDTVARLGGDEFVVMMEGLGEHTGTATAKATAVAKTLLNAFLHTYQVGKYEYSSTASIGITLFPGGADTVDELLKRADLALYRAKARGRNALCFFDPAMEIDVASRAALQADLRRAIQNREFALHYQPQVQSNGEVMGAEALLRWRHPRRGLVSPGEFIPLAEEVGLIGDLGQWALETACAQLTLWAKRPEMESLGISVNVSIRQVLEANFVNTVKEAIRKSGANPRRLKLEITESSVMENVEDTIAKMTALSEDGVGFSLDDFGTGYSSLAHLKRLPLSQLKIDRSFVNDVLTDVKDASIARTIITLGGNLNLEVIAEGVETEGQRKFLEKEGCYAYQGFLFAPALPAAQFDSFVALAQRQKRTGPDHEGIDHDGLDHPDSPPAEAPVGTL